MGETDPIEHRDRIGTRLPAELRRQHQVGGRREVLDQVVGRALEDVGDERAPQLTPAAGRQAAGIRAVDGDAARRGPLDEGDEPQQGGLARTRRPGHHRQTAGRDGDVHITEGRHHPRGEPVLHHQARRPRRVRRLHATPPRGRRHAPPATPATNRPAPSRPPPPARRRRRGRGSAAGAPATGSGSGRGAG